MRYMIPQFEGQILVHPDRILEVLQQFGAMSIRVNKRRGCYTFTHSDCSDYEGAIELDDMQKALKCLHPNIKLEIFK